MMQAARSKERNLHVAQTYGWLIAHRSNSKARGERKEEAEVRADFPKGNQTPQLSKSGKG